MSSDHTKRIYILWCGVGCATLSHLFLLWFPKVQEEEYSDSEGSDTSGVVSKFRDLPGAWKLRLLRILVAKLRRFFF